MGKKSCFLFTHTRGELAQRLSMVSPKVVFLHSDTSLGSLPLSPLAC